MDISNIDKNFKIETNISKTDIKFYDVKNAPFKIYGVSHYNGMFCRIPESVANATSESVACLNKHTAGGRIRFKTNSSYIAINAKMTLLGKMPHFAFSGSIGFDLYIKENGKYKYTNTFVPPLDITNGYEAVFDFDSAEERDIIINMPLYSNVDELYIGLSEKAIITESDDYKVKKPVVYYGSSITQGGCASRPGMAYESIISREIDCDYINLGFSGSANGEDTIAQYISNLDMSLFVYDYDHNAPSVEHLENTHERMFKIIREKNPSLPILILSRPKFLLLEEEEKRYEVIEKTYKNAISNGDKNVYIIKGTELMKMAEFEGTVDNCHPTDFGFASIAKVLIPKIKNILDI